MIEKQDIYLWLMKTGNWKHDTNLTKIQSHSLFVSSIKSWAIMIKSRYCLCSFMLNSLIDNSKLKFKREILLLYITN